MSIRDIFREKFNTKRSTEIAGTKKFEYVNNLSGQDGRIEYDQDLTLLNGRDRARSFILYCDTIDIIVGDQITRQDDTSKVYEVQDVEPLEYDCDPHLECTLMEKL